MTNTELRTALERRRQDLRMSYREIQKRTSVGYNTVRRVFKDPFSVGFKTVLMVCETLGCTLMFSIENLIPDDIESGTQPPHEEVVEELHKRDGDDAMA